MCLELICHIIALNFAIATFIDPPHGSVAKASILLSQAAANNNVCSCDEGRSGQLARLMKRQITNITMETPAVPENK